MVRKINSAILKKATVILFLMLSFSLFAQNGREDFKKIIIDKVPIACSANDRDCILAGATSKCCSGCNIFGVFLYVVQRCG